MVSCIVLILLHPQVGGTEHDSSSSGIGVSVWLLCAWILTCLAFFLNTNHKRVDSPIPTKHREDKNGKRRVLTFSQRGAGRGECFNTSAVIFQAQKGSPDPSRSSSSSSGPLDPVLFAASEWLLLWWSLTAILFFFPHKSAIPLLKS